MKNLTIAYIILGTIALTPMTAQELLSKEEAIRLTLENNFDIEVARNDLETAGNNADILNSGYLPTLTGTAGANYDLDNSTTTFPDDDTREDNVVEDAESRTYNASVSVNYTLFDGLGRMYNYKSLKEQYQLSELQMRETIENTVFQLFSVYYEVARLTENEKALKQALNISNDRITREQYAFEFGQNTKLDVLNAKVDATNDSINLLNSRQTLQTTKRDLSVLLNQDLNKEFAVDTLVSFIPKLQMNTYVEEANNNNVSLLQAQKNINISAYDIKINRSDYLPQIDLTGSYGWNYSQSAASAFFPSANTDSNNFGLGASLTWNLFDGGGAKTRVRNAKLSLENQKVLKEQAVLQVNRDILNAQTTYENLVRIYQIQEQNVITNQNNFERSQEQFKLGQITSIEFRQAQTNLLNAQTDRNSAKYDAKLAELQLLQLTGQLLNVDF